MTVNQYLLFLQHAEAENELEKIPKDLWAVKQFDKSDYWFLQTGL